MSIASPISRSLCQAFSASFCTFVTSIFFIFKCDCHVKTQANYWDYQCLCSLLRSFSFSLIAGYSRDVRRYIDWMISLSTSDFKFDAAMLHFKQNLLKFYFHHWSCSRLCQVSFSFLSFFVLNTRSTPSQTVFLTLLDVGNTSFRCCQLFCELKIIHRCDRPFLGTLLCIPFHVEHLMGLVVDPFCIPSTVLSTISVTKYYCR